MPKKKDPDAKKRQFDYVNGWIRDKKLRVTALLDKEQDKEIIAKLKSVPNKTDYIRQLIALDIERNP